MFECSTCGATRPDDCTCCPIRDEPQHNEARLPKWAQERLADLRREVARQATELATLHAAHEVLYHRDWFTVNGRDVEPDRPVRLWTLHNDGAHPVCSIGTGDVLLVGRARKEKQ